MLIRHWIVIPLLALLTGCGFHLRGNTDINAQLNPIAIQVEGGNQQFHHCLEKSLRKHGATLTDAKQAKSLLTLSNFSHGTDTLTHNSSSTQSTVYALSTHITVQLTTAHGKALDSKRQFNTRDNLDIGPNESLTSNRQVIDIKQSLETHLINQIIAYLGAYQQFPERNTQRKR